jgi:5-hydroxyisourate hydrolase-like protein (transthyretin family)
MLTVLLLSGAALSASQRRLLPPGGALVGQVVDAESGAGLRRAVVTLDGSGVQRRVVSDDRGRFLFTGLPGGDYHLAASRPGYLNGSYGQRRPAGAATVVTLVAGQWIGQLDIRLWKPGVITGDVRDAHGDPAVGITVRAYRHDREPGRATLREVAAAVTDDTGWYRLASLIPGDHMVGISSQTVDVRPLSPASDADAGGIPPDVPPDPPAHIFPPQYYPFADLVAGAARVPVSAGREYVGVSFLLPSTPAVTVSGHLRMPPSLDGLSEPVVLMLARPRDPSITESQHHRVLAVTTTDTEGRFTFSEIPSGQFEIEAAITATPEGAYWASEALTVTDRAVTDVVVTMHQGLDVHGRLRVVSRDSRPLPPPDRMAITLEPLFDVPGVSEVRAVIDETGTFRTGPLLTPGPYLVRVAVPPSGFTLRSVMSGGIDVSDHPLDLSSGFAATDLEVTLTDQRTSLIGTVRGDGPFGDPTATVLLFPPDAAFGQRAGGTRRFRSVRTTRDGTFTIRDVPPGAYLAVAVDDADVEGWQDPARLQQWRARATPLSIREGEAKVIELRRLSVREKSPPVETQGLPGA